MSEQTTQTCSQSNPRAIRFGPARKVLFTSAHLIVVPSNGAAVATLDVLQGLAASGFESQAFCTSKLDLHADVSLEKIITVSSEPYQVRPSTCASGHARVLYTRRYRVPITVVRLESTRHVQQRPEEVRTVLDLFRKPSSSWEKRTRPSWVARSSKRSSSQVVVPSSWQVNTSTPRRRSPEVIAIST